MFAFLSTFTLALQLQVEPLRQDTDIRTGQPLEGSDIDGRYTLKSKLGEGGMGMVFRATQLSTNREVALKIVKLDAGDDGRIQRFQQEIDIISGLSHPSIVRVFDTGTLSGHDLLYVVMELIEGISLSDILWHKHAEGQYFKCRTKVEFALEVVYQLCAALTEPHRQGIIHRDIKPENILLAPSTDETVQIKVLDFGIARVLSEKGSEQKKMTDSRIPFIGTPHYMAPEQVARSQYDPRTDLYAVGVILYELLTGQYPFDDDNILALLLQKTQQDPPALVEQIPDEIPYPEVIALTESLIARDQERRPVDAMQVRRIIEDIRDKYRMRRVRVDATTFLDRTPDGDSDDDEPDEDIRLEPLRALYRKYLLYPSGRPLVPDTDEKWEELSALAELGDISGFGLPSTSSIDHASRDFLPERGSPPEGFDEGVAPETGEHEADDELTVESPEDDAYLAAPEPEIGEAPEIPDDLLGPSADDDEHARVSAETEASEDITVADDAESLEEDEDSLGSTTVAPVPQVHASLEESSEETLEDIESHTEVLAQPRKHQLKAWNVDAAWTDSFQVDELQTGVEEMEEFFEVEDQPSKEDLDEAVTSIWKPDFSQLPDDLRKSFSGEADWEETFGNPSTDAERQDDLAEHTSSPQPAAPQDDTQLAYQETEEVAPLTPEDLEDSAPQPTPHRTPPFPSDQSVEQRFGAEEASPEEDGPSFPRLRLDSEETQRSLKVDDHGLPYDTIPEPIGRDSEVLQELRKAGKQYLEDNPSTVEAGADTGEIAVAKVELFADEDAASRHPERAHQATQQSGSRPMPDFGEEDISSLLDKPEGLDADIAAANASASTSSSSQPLPTKAPGTDTPSASDSALLVAPAARSSEDGALTSSSRSNTGLYVILAIVGIGLFIAIVVISQLL